MVCVAARPCRSDRTHLYGCRNAEPDALDALGTGHSRFDSASKAHRVDKLRRSEAWRVPERDSMKAMHRPYSPVGSDGPSVDTQCGILVTFASP